MNIIYYIYQSPEHIRMWTKEMEEYGQFEVVSYHLFDSLKEHPNLFKLINADD